ncbi:MAG: radical SAM family heme chaperone HemW, partial [Armatimonadota bacterium]
MLGLYVHIPFCVRQCPYCDFSSHAGLEAHLDDYVSALALEAEAAGAQVAPRAVETMYIGGGTPSVLSCSQMARLMQGLKACFDVRAGAEMTVEVNPDTATLEKLEGFRELGLNRLSIGFQSLDDTQLGRLGRLHTAERALQSFSFARDAGFANISVDLMYAIPEQSRADWRRTIQRVTALRPEHVSAYALTLEDGAPMHGEVEAGRVTLPPEETVVAMAESTIELLGQAGYE